MTTAAATAAAPRRTRRLATITLGATIALLGLAGTTTVSASASASAAAPAPAIVAAPQAATYQSNVALLTNQRRAAAGLRPVTTSTTVTLAAQRHASYQASIYTMTHVGAGGTNGGQRITAAGFPWTSWGENVAAGQMSSTDVVNAWMNSPSHRANMLNPTFTYVGVGLSIRNGVWFWTLNFASR